jgi:predicted DNA binding CopG/RHH family protein
MPGKTERSPVFRSAPEEREFWESHDSTPYVDWSAAQRAVLPNLKPTTETISLRLPKHLLEAIKTAANARDVPYQSLIKIWLQEHAERAPRPPAAKSTRARAVAR